MRLFKKKSILEALRMAGFTQGEAEQVARYSKISSLQDGYKLTEIGGYSSEVYLLVSGTVLVSKASGDSFELESSFDKPVVTIFNKMDLYRTKHFDEWVSDEVKQDLERDLKERWINATNNNCVFVSAIEKQNIDELRTVILHKVRDMYQIKYPYKTVFF